MSDNKEKLPQEGTSSRGESLSVTIPRTAPSYSGGGNYHFVGTESPRFKFSSSATQIPDQNRLGVSVRDCTVRLTRQIDCQEPEPRANTSSEVNFASQETAGHESTGRSNLEDVPDAAERVKRKRKRLRPASSVLSSSDEGSTCASAGEGQPKAKGRGRPPTSGKYVGLARAKEAYNRALREELRLKAEMEVQEMSIRTRQGYQMDTSSLARTDSEDAEANQDLGQQVADSVAIITKVATKSKNLSGGYVKSLKEAAVAIADAFSELSRRTATEETARLQADNNRLQTEMASLRKELAEMKMTLEGMRKQGSPPPPPTGKDKEKPPPARPPQGENMDRRVAAFPPATEMDHLCRAIMAHVGPYLDARLAGIQDRLLPEKPVRPPLAADARSARTDKQAEVVPTSGTGPRSGAAPKKKRKRKKKTKNPTPNPRPPTPPPPERPSTSSEWTQVGKKGRRKKKKKDGVDQQVGNGEHPKPSRGKKSKARKLRSPRSAAVVVTLLEPKAADKGADFGTVLAEVKRKVRLKELGISGLRFRKAQTGAYVMEVPGTSSGDKANALAKRLAEVVDPEVVRISRPTKCAELRISGLDESVLFPEVVAAVARVGGCQETDIRSGEVVRGPSGLGVVWLRCPIPAAKKVVEAGRLLVGWVSAQVKLLDARPLRCFRCLEVGHVAAKCKSEVDRSRACYRCGRPGHVAGNCTSSAHCPLCAEAGLAANHRVGSKACDPPKSKRRTAGADSQATLGRNTRKDSNVEQRDEEAEIIVE